MQSKSIKCLEENSGKYLHYIEGKIQENIFMTLNGTHKALTVKEKKISWTSLNLRSFLC